MILVLSVFGFVNFCATFPQGEATDCQTHVCTLFSRCSQSKLIGIKPQSSRIYAMYLSIYITVVLT